MAESGPDGTSTSSPSPGAAQHQTSNPPDSLLQVLSCCLGYYGVQQSTAAPCQHPASTHHHSLNPSSSSMTPPHPAALLGFLLICMGPWRASGIHWQPTNEPARRADMVSPPPPPPSIHPFYSGSLHPIDPGFTPLSSDLALQQTLSSLDPHFRPSDPQRANCPTVV
ncbi:unnamed protein product [Arctogadus glacialis]